MNLKIGLIGKNPAIEVLLSQEGLIYDYLDLDKKILKEDYAVVICLNKITADFSNLRNYISDGGAVLFDSISFVSLENTENRKNHPISLNKKNVKHLSATSDDFSHIGTVDLSSTILIPSSKNLTCLDEGLKIFRKKSSNVIVFPYDLQKLIFNERIKRKKFGADRKELASERVSAVSKGGIRKIILRCLELLFDFRNLPMVQKWYFPNKNRAHFIFRVDTDFCDQSQANLLYDLCRKYDISASWFVDTKNIERLKNCYAKMENQEIGLHCFHHIVFDDYVGNKENIDKGLENLNSAKIKVDGFVAPLGEWNRNLAKVLVENNFTYSSEFGYDYDNFPSWQKISDKQILQIPIHSVSTGRMRRSHFSEDEMVAYYKNVIDQKISANEIIVLYHHPSHPHLAVFDRIFDYLKSLDIPTSTMLQFANWWEKRQDIKLSLNYENKIIQIKRNQDINLRIYSKNMDTVVFSKDEISVDEQDFSKVKRVKINDLVTKKFHWRELLYDYETFRGKRLQKENIKDEK